MPRQPWRGIFIRREGETLCQNELVANRASDWMRQALADLATARTAEQSGNYQWTCFAAQQAAEKALKSVGLA